MQVSASFIQNSLLTTWMTQVSASRARTVQLAIKPSIELSSIKWTHSTRNTSISWWFATADNNEKNSRNQRVLRLVSLTKELNHMRILQSALLRTQSKKMKQGSVIVDIKRALVPIIYFFQARILQPIKKPQKTTVSSILLDKRKIKRVVTPLFIIWTLIYVCCLAKMIYLQKRTLKA